MHARELDMGTSARIVLCLVGMALTSSSSPAQPVRDLANYTCSQVLGDREEVASEKRQRLNMMVAWATGYAAAHQKGDVRADATAVEIMRSVLIDSCQSSRDRTAIQAIVA